MNNIKKHYTFINIGINDDEPLYQLDTELKDAIEINPVHFQTPIDAVVADAPLPEKNSDEIYVVIFDGEARDLSVSKNIRVKKDHRGITVWHKESLTKQEWMKVTLDEEYTTIEPPNNFCTFVEAQTINDELISAHWVVDEVKQREQAATEADKQYRESLNAVNGKIDNLEFAINDGLTEDPTDIEHLKALKRYRFALSKVKQQADYPLSIDWPETP